MDLTPLEPFVGTWSIEADFPGQGPTGPGGRCVFEWALGGSYLLQRSEVDHPDAPDALSVIAAGDAPGAYTQHYFDSRGVVRVYAMTFADGAWELLRTAPDFSPLSFSQRYVGAFGADGDVIDGRWETSDDAQRWELDFGLTYRRLR